MDIVVYFIRETAWVLLSVIQLAMLVRAILSWIDPTGEGRLSGFLYVITEPVILPLRKLCRRFHWFEGTPLDMPFMLTLVVLMILQTLLELL